MRNTLDALLRQLVFRNVGRHPKTAQDLPALSDMGKKLDLEVARLAVWKLARPLVSDRMSLQHLHKMAFDLPVHLLPDHLSQVLAENVLDGKTEKPGVRLVGEAATQVLVIRDGHGRNVVGDQAQLLCTIAQGLFRLLARGDVCADTAVALERAGLIEHRIPTDRDMPLGAVGPEARELEIAERPVRDFEL